jgi:hypothetical protein
MRFKKPKNISPAKTHPGKNLGKFLHKSKLPTGAKIGAGMTTHTKSGKTPGATPRTTKSPGRSRSAAKTTHPKGTFKASKKLGRN